MDYDFAEKQGFVLGLVLGCPFEYSLADCPVNALRGMSLEDKTKAVKEMSEDTLNELITYHSECNKKRID